jgi:predicted DNA-binding transcriptional regulator AlpA
MKCKKCSEGVEIPPLVGHKEVREMLGWSKSQLDTYIRRAATKEFPPGMFPKPIQVLASGPIWTRAQIEEWEKNRQSGDKR